jgi:hypothetical protein
MVFGFYTFRSTENNKVSNINEQTKPTEDKESIILAKTEQIKKEHPEDSASFFYCLSGLCKGWYCLMPVPICLDDEHYIQANVWVIHAC